MDDKPKEVKLYGKTRRPAGKHKPARERYKDSSIPLATHHGELKIGDISIPCCVLEDGSRVFTKTGLFKALNRARKGSQKSDSPNPQKGELRDLPAFLRAKNVLPFISERLRSSSNLVTYRRMTGGGLAIGYRAELLPEICNTYLNARDAGVLKPAQLATARMCEILIRAFATVGVVALVDEATGYQFQRDRDELHRILEAYISRELLPWTKRFPDDFYEQLFRLWGWQYRPLTVKRPRHVGILTKRLVYEKLPPGVLQELERKNPVQESGRRRHKHHQFLTEDVGNPHLEKQLISVITLMRAAPNRRVFERLFERAFPTGPIQLEMDLGEDDDI